MTLDRRSFSQSLVAGLGLGLAGTSAFAQSRDRDRDRSEEGGMRSGKLFTSTNGAAGNELLVVGAAPGGTLALLVRYQTLGLGSGAGLGSQGAVTLSGDGRHLFVVNAGSNSVSTFAVHADALTLISIHDSGGLHPISVAESNGIVYVLNDGGGGNVAGFRDTGGTLAAIAGSIQPLSAAGRTAPAQIAIGTDGDLVMVTEKNSNRLLTYALDGAGRVAPPIITASPGATPFGFTFDRRNRAFVSEAAASTLSSYRFDSAAPVQPVVVSGAVPNGQAAACWAAVTPNGRFVYTGNAGNNSISQFAIDRRGAVTLVNGAAASTGTAGANDLAIAPHGRTLSVLAPRGPGIFSFTVANNGTLAPAGAVLGLPTGAVGLAAN
jgi:6-phosphogluconolactonase (cycloisomerase 2 family)